MQAFVTEELMWALHRERVEDARRVWLASRVVEQPGDDNRSSSGPSRAAPLNHYGPSGLRPAGGR